MDPASVIITGAGIAPSSEVITDAQKSPNSSVLILHPSLETPANENPKEPVHEPPVVDETGALPPNNLQDSGVKNLDLAENSANFPHAESRKTPISYVPQKLPKAPTWQKANVTLEPEDMAILDHSDARARSYGFRIRKGGNPSLFVRAGLRLLNDLLEKDPDIWVKRIAETIPSPDS